MTDSTIPQLTLPPGVGGLVRSLSSPVPQQPALVDFYRRVRENSEKADAETWAATMRTAIATDPGVAAEADKLSRKLGLPVGDVQQDIGFLRAVSVLNRMREDRIESTNPVLYKSMGGLEFTRKAWNDYEHLSNMERWGQAIRRGLLTSARGRAATRLAMGDTSATAEFEAVERELATLGPTAGPFSEAMQVVGYWGANMPRAFATGLASSAAAATTVAIAGQVGPQAAVPEEVVTVPVAAVWGFNAGFWSQYAADAVATEGGNAYADMIAAGYDPTRARIAAGGVGLVNAILEVGGLGFATAPLRQAVKGQVMKLAGRELAAGASSGFLRGFAGAYARAELGEVVPETIQELNTIIGETLAARPGDKDLSPEGVAARLWEVASKTAQGMAFLGLPGAYLGGKHARALADLNKQDQDALKAGGAIADRSNLQAKDPTAFGEFASAVLRQGANNPEAHIDALALRDLLAKVDAAGAATGELRKSTADVLEGILPGFKEELESAIESGGDMSFAVADLVSRIRGEAPEFAVALEDSGLLRFDPDAVAEGKTAEGTQEAEKQAATADTGTDEAAKFYEELRAVETEAAKSIKEASGPKVSASQARELAKGYAAIIEQIAANEKITPAEAAKTYGPTFKQDDGTEAEALNQFAGPRAKGAPRSALQKAYEMLDAGTDASEVFKATGWSVGPTGNLRFEISDDAANLLGRENGTLESVLAHPALFKAYPKLALVPVRFANLGGKIAGEFRKPDGVIGWNPSRASILLEKGLSDEMALSTLLHEVQHAIQSIEGDYRGDTKTWWANPLEAEARNVQARATLTKEQRRQSEPSSTEDVPREMLAKNEQEMTADAIAAAEQSAKESRQTRIADASKKPEAIEANPNILRQGERGKFVPKLLAILFGDNDVTTVLHELTHWFVEVVERLAKQGSKYGQEQFGRLLTRWNLTAEQWDGMDLAARRPFLEDISYNAEEYFASGQAPSAELKGLFDKLRSFIVNVYRNLRATLLADGYLKETGQELKPITPELRDFFDRMLASEQAIEIERATREGAARLSDEAAKAVGIAGEDLAEIRRMEQDRFDEAKAHLTKESLRGARFFQAGRRKAEADAKRKLRESQARIRAEVEKGMADSPAQAAIYYFRDGLVLNPDGTKTKDESARKLDAAMVRDVLGLPKIKGGEKGKSMVARIRELGGIRVDGYPGDLRGEHKIPGVFRKNGGQPWERIAQQLASEGYGGEVYDSGVVDAVDNTWLVDALKDAAQGTAIYPAEFVSDSTRMQAEYEAWLRSKGAEEDAAVAANRAARSQAEALFTRLARRRLLQVDGLNPDAYAPMFSFASGEQMLRVLADAPLREEYVRAETARRLTAEEPLANPAEFRRVVEESLHGKTATRLVATVLRAMLKGLGQTVAGLEAQAREAARITLLRTPVGRITVRAMAAAELRAAKARDQALKSGKLDEAIDAQRRYLVQHYMTREAAKIEREVERGLRSTSDRYGKGDEAIISGRRNLDIVNAARVILGRFGLFPEQRANRAAAALSEMQEHNPSGHQQLAVRIALATQDAKPWAKLPLDRFKALMAEADGMWSEAHRAEQVRIGGVMRARAEVQAELEGQIVDLWGGGTVTGLTMGKTDEAPSTKGFDSILASLTRIEAWTIKMDGGKLGGPWHRNVYQPLKDATVAMDLEMAEHSRWIRDHLAKFDDLGGPAIDLQQFLGEGRRAVFQTRAELIGALLQMGTESNFRNFILGNKLGEQQNGVLVTRWAEALQHAASKGRLTKRDFDLVQEVWDYIRDNLKGRLFATTREVWGFYPEAVEAMAFDTPFGRYPGGYFPSKVDKGPGGSTITEQQAAEAVRDGRQDFVQANRNVPRGVTISRQQNAVQPRITDLNVLEQHISEVLQIIHVAPALSDSTRLFGGRQNTMAATLTQVQPFAMRNIIMPAWERLQRNSIVAPSDSVIAAIAGWIKQSASIYFLGFNPRNAAQQFTGLANAVPVVGFRRLFDVLVQNGMAPRQAIAKIEADSDAMRNRWSRDQQLMAQDIQRMLNPSKMRVVREEATAAAFFLQRYAQMATDAAVWMAAKAKATEEGKAEADAIKEADATVRLTQGEKTPLDVPRALSGDAVKQLLTQFADYPNTVLNQNIAAPVGKRFATFAWTLIVPTMASSMLAIAFAFGNIGKGARDDEDYAERMVKHLLGDQVRGIFGMIPVGGGIAGSALNRLFGLTNDPGGMRNQPFAGWTMVEAIARTLSGEAKPADALATVMAGLGIPARPVVNVVRYSGKEESADADWLDYVRVLLNGH